ncbi:MAG: ATP-binding cassette domain-containing protein [Verrucomicrobia bacterium]|nr:MAG: ATP-binding cassette domain-containing protein [Verrucomicrobiota bacterium]
MTSASILHLDRVSLAAQLPYAQDLTEITLELCAGELGLVLVPPHSDGFPLADLAEGLVTPDSGSIKFEDMDWEDMLPDQAAAARGRIGRVFEKRGWISNLDMDENITLAERHHTTRPLAEIEVEALTLAKRFGFDDLPRVRPALLRGGDLRRAAWIRALLGAPTLILLEHPLREIPSANAAQLLDTVQAARTRGAAALWIAESFQGLENHREHFSRVWKLEGARLAAAKE